MSRGLAALSASVVAAIYTAGYLRTQPVDASLDASEPAAISVVTNVPTPTTMPVPAPAAQPAQPARQAQPAQQAQPRGSLRTAPTPTTTTPPASNTAANTGAAVAGYKDGTFSGMGTSRRGNVWVDVTVQNGRISTVNITRSTLQYPVRDIAGLPQEVVSRQSAQVDIVSGATYSSQAFRTAVSQALGQAKA
jgi:uncharacterized protein with FMN-binding domain